MRVVDRKKYGLPWRIWRKIVFGVFLNFTSIRKMTIILGGPGGPNRAPLGRNFGAFRRSEREKHDHL